MFKIITAVIVAGALSVGGYLWFVPRAVNKGKVVSQNADIQIATFAGGCFWCTEADFEKLDGVIEATSGYMGGKAETATYEQTSNKDTGHREVVQLKYDANLVSYKALADYHLKHIDPTDNEGQFADRGYVYSPAMFYGSEAEKNDAQQALVDLNALGVFPEPVSIPVEAAQTFYPAETYHQDYYLKNPVRYQYYRNGSGRTVFLEQTWNQ